ncbi:unnamed protein product [Moneuplotes crassus]|uniref:Uncharacterized protein n=1 Tax=Euplotes crassus TaxID=5936 RepID=A0AAD1U8T5_EUPCR|nr:unnamed protein product [Moneuplotes crassus]
MSKLVNQVICEDFKTERSTSKGDFKAPRRKYKETMSLWSKASGTDNISIDVSTRSSMGGSSMEVLGDYTCSHNYSQSCSKYNQIEKFLDTMNITRVDFSSIMKSTVVTQENKVKFLGNGASSIQSRKKFYMRPKVSSLWERRQNQCKAMDEEYESCSESESI